MGVVVRLHDEASSPARLQCRHVSVDDVPLGCCSRSWIQDRGVVDVNCQPPRWLCGEAST